MTSLRLAAFAIVSLWPAAVLASVPAPQEDGVTRLVASIEQAIRAGNGEAIRALTVPGIRQPQLADFVLTMTATRPSLASVKERDRAPLDAAQLRLMLEILCVREDEGRVSTWRLDARPADAEGAVWKIADVERLTVVSGLYRLALDTSVEYAVHDLAINAPDLTLTVPAGYAYASTTPDGTTAMVVMGRGRAQLAPASEAERGQVRLFCGAEVFKAEFDSVFLRLNPADLPQRLSQASLTPRAVDQGHTRRALQMFETYMPRSFQIDLNDLSTARWSLVPASGDFVAEVVTGKYGSLTYARANAEAEDISFFDRRRRRNIAVYPSQEKLASRGRFFSEDDRADYDVLRYDIETSFAPERAWVDGTTRMTIRTRAAYLSTMTIRLAEPLVIRSITSPQFGRLLHLRVVGQNNVLVGFPGTVPADTDLDLIITYGGRLPPQPIDREAATVQQQEREEAITIPVEPQYVYSNRSYWYPQAPVTDYATAAMTLTVPGEFDVVASGTRQGSAESLPAPPGQRPRRKFVFATRTPVRYLACLITRLQSAAPVPLKLRDDRDPLTLIVTANPRQFNRTRAMSEKAADILKFYASLMADAPYESFTLAITESDLPGGHSPAYFALLNQPLPTSPVTWSNDPVSFQSYPSFFVAHELAHQWWGQAVGWKNYHEQWLSEGIAQYFAALYAEHERGPDPFVSVLRQMRRWAVDMSPQGPVYLGYRLGHLKSDGRVFRALVYDKGAMVLHMLRRLIGDEAFFAGLRDFYQTWRFKKAGTDDLRVTMEKAAGRPLDRFFERWIYNSTIPALRFTSAPADGGLRVRFEQTGEIFDVPVTVSLTYTDGTTQDVVVQVTDKIAERTIPIRGTLRSVDVNKDGAAVAEIVRF